MAARRGLRGCCTFVLHVASSSRTQVLDPSTWAKDPGDLLVLSTNVRWRASVSTAIVTQLVTHPLDDRFLIRKDRALLTCSG